MSKLKIYKVRDTADSYYTKKETIFDLPARLLVVGKSQLSGKSNLLVNLLLREEYYGKDFKGEDIFLISPSFDTDEKLVKMIKVKDIPQENIIGEYDEDVIVEIYKMLEQEYRDAIEAGEKPSNKLIIFDDCSYSGVFKNKTKGSILAKLFSNGRHIMVSTIVTSQKYTDIPTSSRENANGCIFFSCSNKQLELIEADHNYTTDKKSFMALFRDTMKEKHSFFVVNYTNGKENRYMDEEFNVVNM